MKNCVYKEECNEHFSITGGRWMLMPCDWEDKDIPERCSFYQKLKREEEENE